MATQVEQKVAKIKDALGNKGFINWYYRVYALLKAGRDAAYEKDVDKKFKELKLSLREDK